MTKADKPESIYWAVWVDWGNLRCKTDDLGEALRWFDSLDTIEKPDYLQGPTGIIVVDNRPEKAANQSA